MKIVGFAIIAILPSVLAMCLFTNHNAPSWVYTEPQSFHSIGEVTWYTNFPPEKLPGDLWHGADFPEEDNAPQDSSATKNIEVIVGKLRLSKRPGSHNIHITNLSEEEWTYMLHDQRDSRWLLNNIKPGAKHRVKDVEALDVHAKPTYVEPGERKDNDVPLRDTLKKQHYYQSEDHDYQSEDHDYQSEDHDYQSQDSTTQTDLSTLMADLFKRYPQDPTNPSRSHVDGKLSQGKEPTHVDGKLNQGEETSHVDGKDEEITSRDGKISEEEETTAMISHHG